jgi:primosomal protein N' (replication factor Y)
MTARESRVRPVGQGGGLLDVAVALPVMEIYTYRDLPRNGRLPLGTQVVVPVRGRTVTGFVVGHGENAPADMSYEIRQVLEVVGDGPVLDEAVLDLCRWAADYYLAPLGAVLHAALPSGERASSSRRVQLTLAGKAAIGAGTKPGLATMALDVDDRALLARIKKARTLSQAHLARTGPSAISRMSFLVERGFVEVADNVRGAHRRWNRAEIGGCPRVVSARETPPTLNPHQEAALSTLLAAWGQGYATFLLQGITGSGKTEIYLRLIAEARKRGRGALVLVPEIALTPQLAARFRARFGDDVAVLHSAVPQAERVAAWRRLRRGEVGIALGARSAVFAPVRDLAVVVVDEEHDSSFKQEEGFRYHARDLAIMRANQGGAIVVLGSATPCLESYRNVMLRRFQRLLLPVRANPSAAKRPLPGVEVIDLRRHTTGAGRLISPPLAQALERALVAGEQSILFLNRRGFSTMVHCCSCGFVLRCKECAVSLTLHRIRGRMLCHYCGRSEPVRQICPQCRAESLEGMGSGTERVESEVLERFPKARVARLDRDTAAGGRGRVEAMLAKVQHGEVDILIGTQMVAKGHDFGNVTLVGILQPDQGINLPDFRAAERAFQLMEQVAGRAGRGERPGRILVQTYDPQHSAIRYLVHHDYEGFCCEELAQRETAGYPPYSRMVVLRLEGRDVGEVSAAAAVVADGRRRSGAGARPLRGAHSAIAWACTFSSLAVRHGSRETSSREPGDTAHTASPKRPT